MIHKSQVKITKRDENYCAILQEKPGIFLFSKCQLKNIFFDVLLFKYDFLLEKYNKNNILLLLAFANEIYNIIVKIIKQYFAKIFIHYCHFLLAKTKQYSTFYSVSKIFLNYT